MLRQDGADRSHRGAVAVDATVLIVAAVVALVMIGVINALKALQELSGYLRT
jgi:Flp pilus assembly pilin Flp